MLFEQMMSSSKLLRVDVISWEMCFCLLCEIRKCLYFIIPLKTNKCLQQVFVLESKLPDQKMLSAWSHIKSSVCLASSLNEFSSVHAIVHGFTLHHAQTEEINDVIKNELLLIVCPMLLLKIALWSQRRSRMENNMYRHREDLCLDSWDTSLARCMSELKNVWLSHKIIDGISSKSS